MSTWYRARFSTISEVEVVKATEHFVWLGSGNKKSGRRTDDEGYFETREEAVQFLVDNALRNAVTASRVAASKAMYLDNICERFGVPVPEVTK